MLFLPVQDFQARSYVQDYIVSLLCANVIERPSNLFIGFEMAPQPVPAKVYHNGRYGELLTSLLDGLRLVLLVLTIYFLTVNYSFRILS